jgi:hypothetical protein
MQVSNSLRLRLTVFLLIFKQAQTRCIIAVCGNNGWLFFYFKTFFLEERMHISDSLHKLIIPYRMSFKSCTHYMPWRHKGGEEVQLLLILNLGTRWGWVVNVTPRPRFNPFGTHRIRGWVGPEAGLDAGDRMSFGHCKQNTSDGCQTKIYFCESGISIINNTL